jgi:hypothetical protein
MILNSKKQAYFLNLRACLAIFSLLVFSVQYFSQVTYSFNTASATGSAGPTQVQVNAAYLSTNLNGLVTVNAGIQLWMVPVTAAYRVQAIGAKGFGANGGRGASISGDFTLTAGQVLKILVGQQGAAPISPGTNQYGGGGGSFVTYTNNVPLLVAGGGGGSWALAYTGLADGTVAINGNAGTGPGAVVGAGGVNGAGGGAGNNADGGGGISGNGSGTSGGLAFVNGGNGGALFGHGGFGGGGGASAYDSRRCGGGGGYSGGGGSFWTSGNPEGGGGGSINNGTNQTNQSGQNSGDGSVIISRICNITLGTNTGTNLICQGSAITLTTDAISSYIWSTGSNSASLIVSPSVTTTYSLSAMSLYNCMNSAVITISVSSALPSLTVSNSSNSVCPNNTVTISASGALTYTFSGGISNGIAFIPNATTSYTILGQNGCGTSSVVSTISVIPLPVVAAVSNSIICAGSTTTLSSTGALSYTWQPVNFVGNTLLVSPPQNTTYTVTGSIGTCVGTSTVTVFTNPAPSISVSASHFTICNGGSSTLTATGANSYTWQPVGFTGASVVVTPTIPTAFTVIGENSLGCTGSAQQPVIVFPKPTVNAIPNRTLVCSGGPSTITAINADTYSWNTGALTQTVLVTPQVTSIYTVTGTFTNSGCSSTKTVMVQVFSPPSGITGPTAVCIGSSITLSSAPAITYTWSTISNTLSNQANISVSPTLTTTYLLGASSTSNNVTCVMNNSINIQVNPLPIITTSAVANRTLICRFETTTLIASGGLSYNWINQGINTFSINVTPLTTITYTVIGTDQNACSKTSTILIKVSGCGPGIDEHSIQTLNIQIYPNPSSGEFNISSEESIDLLLINELGQLVKEIKIDSVNTNSINIKSLAKGIYFLNSKDPRKRVNKKIVVQ